MEIVVEGKDSVNYIPQSLPGIAIGGTRKKAFFRLRCQKRLEIGWDWERRTTKRRKTGSTSSVSVVPQAGG